MSGRSRPTTRKKLERMFGPSGPAGPSEKTQESPPNPPDSPPSKSLESLARLEQEVLGADASEEKDLSLKQRLERLVEVTSRAQSKRLTRVDERAEEHYQEFSASLEDKVGGVHVENDHGALHLVTKEFPLDHRHGNISLSRLESVSTTSFSILARGDDGLELDLTRTVFLDTETTGLAGGSGTSAFLVGVGAVEEGQFIVRQFFMRDYSEEEAMLHELANYLSDFESLVTFNGKSFDVPLLESRYVLARLPFPLSNVPHFDLLHPARNLWKARLESCRLAELEYTLLGHEREDDVPGALIPGIYFDFVRNQDASRIFRVFTHNCDDILSLAALTVQASDMIDENTPAEHPLDHYSLGRIFEKAAQPERSMQHYNRVLESGISGVARRRTLHQLALQHKRRGEIDDAVVLWKELAGNEGAESVLALEELAMVCEHHERSFECALEYCEQALTLIEDDYRLPLAFRERRREAFRHRRRRLVRRMGK